MNHQDMIRCRIKERVHQVHVLLADGTEVVVPCWLDGDERVMVPMKLLLAANWAFDLDAGEVLKNRTPHAFIPSIAATEVTREWLIEHGYIRARRKTLSQDGDFV